MRKRHPTKSKPAKAKTKAKTKAKDPCLAAVGKIWPNILMAYDNFKEFKPIVEYRLRQQIVYVYPALDYINDLSERTREQTRRLYREITNEGKFMVFVSDARKRILRSYVFDIEKPEYSRPDNPAS